MFHCYAVLHCRVRTRLWILCFDEAPFSSAFSGRPVKHCKTTYMRWSRHFSLSTLLSMYLCLDRTIHLLSYDKPTRAKFRNCKTTRYGPNSGQDSVIVSVYEDEKTIEKLCQPRRSLSYDRDKIIIRTLGSKFVQYTW